MKVIKNCLYLCSISSRHTYKFLIWKTCIAAINAIIGVSNLYFLRYAINNVQSGGTFRDSAVILLLMCVGIIVSQTIISAVNIKLSAQMSYIIQSAIKESLFTQAVSVNLLCYEDPEYYKKYTFTMSQCVSRINALIDCTASFVGSLIILISSGVLSLIVDPFTLLFSFLPFITLLLRNKRDKVNHEKNRKASDINRQKDYVRRVFYQNIYAKDLKTTNIYKPLLERFHNASKAIIEVYKKDGAKVAIIFIIESFLNKTFSEYAVLIYAAWKTVVVKTMQYGDCLIIVSTLQNVYDSINGILESVSSFHEHSLYAEDLREFLEHSPTEHSTKGSKTASCGDISIQNLSFKYPGADHYALRDVNMDIKNGEKVAIVGPNGAGKSTLIKLLLRLYVPTAGQIKINEDNYNELSTQSIRDLYSVVLQDYKHFTMSVRENVELGIDSSENTVRMALEKSGLMSRVSMMENGMDSLLDKEIDDCGELLSGGEQQKLALSHVYLKNSNIVILDEPASALDPVAEHDMYEQMLNVSSNKTVIFISHRLSSTVAADRIFYLDNGRIAESGTHRELMKKGGLYAELFRMQAKNYQGD